MKRRNKGITLITLIITIIVMLILVAVSVNIAIKNGLFDSAKIAAKKTENAYKKENTVGNALNIESKMYNSVEEYLKDGTPEKEPTECTIHEWGEWEIETEATCIAEGNKRRTCLKCGKVEMEKTELTDHEWDTTTGTCLNCNVECTHTWSDWKTIQALKSTQPGIKERTCSTCGKVEQEITYPSGW